MRLVCALVLLWPLVALTQPCGKDPESSWNPDVRSVGEKLKRFYSLEDLVKQAYEAGDFAGATILANEYVDLAQAYRCNWNYGNAIHDGHRYLGLISLKKGDAETAVKYLLLAGKSTGSPQLNTFGPDLDLADALLKHGRAEAVKLYLRDIKLFREMDNGKVQLWLDGIDKGEKPELNRFASHAGPFEIMLATLTFAWPAALAAAFTFFLRRRIAARWVFAIVAFVAGCLAMVGTGMAVTFVLADAISAFDAHRFVVLAVLYAGMASPFLVALLAVFGVSRLFLSKPEKSTA
jgi:hypothetical protein